MARTAAQVAYDIYYSQARLAFMRGQVVTAGQIRAIFRRAAEDTAQRMRHLLPSQPSAGSLAALKAELDALAYRLSDDVLVATLNGIELSSGAGVTMARRSAEILLQRYYGIAGIAALYGSVNTRAVVALATRTHSDGLKLSDRVWRVGRQWRGEVARSTESAVARGLDSRTLAKEVQTHLRPGTVSPHTPAVRRRLGLSRSVDWRAMRLARTEMNHAAREATILGHGAHPAYQGVNWVLSSAHPFEDECDDLANESPYAPGREPDDPHANCVIGGTVVSGPRPVASTTRWYSGQVVEIRTAEGRQATVTPNHPVLTDRGWIAAGELYEGCRLVCGRFSERHFTSVSPDDQQPPAFIEEVAETLGRASAVMPVSMPTAAEDFHGDGRGSKIHVVRTNRLLRDGLDAAVFEPLGKQLFGGRDSEPALLASPRTLALLSERVGPAAHRGMGGSGPGSVLLRSADSMYEYLGGSPAASVDASFIQNAGDHVSPYSMPSRESLYGFAVDVSLDQIIEIRRYPFAGHVYNLETTEGWFIANGIVTHNCMCSLEPVMEDSEDFDARMQRWLDDPGSEPGIEAWHQDFASPFFDGRPITALGGGIVAPSARRVSQEKTVEQVYQELRAELRAQAGRG